VYLSDDLAAAVEASGVPLAELIRRGLAGAAPPAVTRPETPGEIRAKVTTSRAAAELARAIAAERRQLGLSHAARLTLRRAGAVSARRGEQARLRLIA
jgi:hypothetical protein